MTGGIYYTIPLIRRKKALDYGGNSKLGLLRLSIPLYGQIYASSNGRAACFLLIERMEELVYKNNERQEIIKECTFFFVLPANFIFPNISYLGEQHIIFYFYIVSI